MRRLEVKDRGGSPLTAYRFTVNDAREVGYGPPHHLTPEQAGVLLAIACSLTDHRVLFWGAQPVQLSTSVEFGEIPSTVAIVQDPKGTGTGIVIGDSFRLTESVNTLVGSTITIDEAKIIDVASRLLKIRIFDKSRRTLAERNLLEAMRSYKDALRSTGRLTSYKALYVAFEKGVNIDKDRDQKAFDAEASRLTKLPENEIEALRLFNNRLKHTLRHKGDFQALQSGESRFGELVRNLKQVADLAILARI